MTQKRHDEIVSLIEDLIRTGELAAGDRIPSERYLAEKYQVSRNTVREAIKALAEKAVVVSRRGAGTFVAEGALSCMIDGVTRKKRRINEIIELRSMLEPQIAALAANRIDDQTLKELEEILNVQAEAVASGRDRASYDEQFHRLLVRATGNGVLLDIYDTVHDVLAESRVNELQSQERSVMSLGYHQQIFDALQRKSSADAARHMQEHMVQVEQNLAHLTEERPQDKFTAIKKTR
ncbi:MULTISPECIES: FadR/GntR family transcriptional regulator [Desulfosediminicola]|uniref:FadR/GntR family transcriptional regulator n=1 Tax=Desulfosediminicola TaxID=2886823 RepID=UPI0010AC0B2F|nr:FadR/GntR family transcriptional regulator [Desulfosediminicola ganghwensis]